MGLNLPPIPGDINPANKENHITTTEDGEEDFNFEALPFKPEYMYSTPDEPKQLLTEGTKVLGSPGASLTWGIDGNRMIPALQAGKDGEQQTASLLNTLADKYKNMYVFHSLSWPESSGDTDHVVLYGDTIYVIDSKRWKASRKYSVNSKGHIMRGTVAFPSGKVRLGSALHVWRKKFPGYKVKGIINIAQEKVFVVKDKNWYKAPYRVVPHEQLEEHLVEEFNKQKTSTKVSGKTLLALSLLLVKPRDRISEIIRVGGESRLHDRKVYPPNPPLKN